jgi:hypothetical protein
MAAELLKITDNDRSVDVQCHCITIVGKLCFIARVTIVPLASSRTHASQRLPANGCVIHVLIPDTWCPGCRSGS